MMIARGAIQDHPERASYTEAFRLTGFGIWQYFLLLQCGWANASDAVEIMCVSFIIPSVRDSMQVSYSALSALTIVLFFGMLIGGYLWGSLADTYGRRWILILSLFVNATFAVMSAFCRTYWLLLLFRFFSGIGVGGSLPVCFSYFSEFQVDKNRGAMISALATCWMAGNFLVAGFAWFILPESRNLSYISPFGEQWRFFVIVCTLPSFSSAFFFCFMPESPKFLYEKERYRDALEVLKTMFKWNYSDTGTFPVKALLEKDVDNGIMSSCQDENCNQDEQESLLTSHDNSMGSSYSKLNRRTYPMSVLYKIQRGGVSFYIQLQRIFSIEQGLRTTSLALTFIYVMVAFGGYGMAMWMPVLMEKTESNNGSPCRGQAIPRTTNDTSNMYTDILIGTAAQLPANVFTMLIIDKVGAKIILIMSMILTSLCALLFWSVNTKLQVVAMMALFNAVSTVVWDGLDVISVEVFPTSIRSSAIGHLNGVSRLGAMLGNLIFGVFMDVNCGIPIMTTFAAYFLSGLIAFKLTNTRNINFE